MKIKGWEKISGYTYKGYTIVNPIHNAQETNYNATILDLNHIGQKPKWELSVLTPQHKFILGENTADGIFYIVMWDDNKNHISRHVSKQRMKSISIFRNEYEEMIDEMLRTRWAKQSTSAPISHSFQSNGTQRMYINSNGHATIGTGIINHINQSGTTIPYGQIVQSIQSMQQTITNLTNDVNNK